MIISFYYVSTGFIDTPMTQNAKVQAKVVNQLLALISLGRVGLPEGKHIFFSFKSKFRN